jgi:hypothetical protein
MTPAATWHPAEELLQSYVDARLAGLSAGSVEAHLLACATCRARVAEGVPAERLTRVRDDLDDRLDALQRPWFERLLVRCGMAEADARALLCAPSLRRAWVLAVLATVVLGLLVAGDDRDPTALFLLLAPLVPLVTTAVAYAPALDPAFPLVAATPYRTVRMLLARTLAVGATALAGLAVVAVAVPDRHVAGLVWLLPTLALTLLVLVLAPRVGTTTAAWGVGTAWVVTVGALHRRGMDVAWVADAATQAGAGVVAAAALAVLVHQWARLDLRGTP